MLLCPTRSCVAAGVSVGPSQQVDSGLTLSDLPVHMLSNILHRLSDGWDIVTLGQVTPTLFALSEDRQLWKKLCQYHFGEKQVSGAVALMAEPGRFREWTGITAGKLAFHGEKAIILKTAQNRAAEPGQKQGKLPRNRAVSSC